MFRLPVKMATYLRMITGLLLQAALSQAQLSTRELRASQPEHRTGQTHNRRIQDLSGRGMRQPAWGTCNKTNQKSFYASTRRKLICLPSIYSNIIVRYVRCQEHTDLARTPFYWNNCIQGQKAGNCRSIYISILVPIKRVCF